MNPAILQSLRIQGSHIIEGFYMLATIFLLADGAGNSSVQTRSPCFRLFPHRRRLFLFRSRGSPLFPGRRGAVTSAQKKKAKEAAHKETTCFIMTLTIRQPHQAAKKRNDGNAASARHGSAKPESRISSFALNISLFLLY
ncbi:hypothetical protein M5E88_02090 [Akkermansia muciniphila]|nr:hypothetical protein M5E88_02090 [Akkermansia muciniphila]